MRADRNEGGDHLYRWRMPRKPRSGRLGWRFLRYGNNVRELRGGESPTTNNRMELKAAIEALGVLKEPCSVELYTDSRYLRDGITKWLPDWRRRDWLTRARKPVKNRDLWMLLDNLVRRHYVDWRWVKGHAGHAGNERADALANAGLEQTFSGDGTGLMRQVVLDTETTGLQPEGGRPHRRNRLHRTDQSPVNGTDVPAVFEP